MTDFYLDNKKVLKINLISNNFKITATELILSDGGMFLVRNFSFFAKETLITDGQKMILTNNRKNYT